ncbi:PspC domain-containing protein [Melioribacteraceae bacterium 4301-Me]|uniref:PspC domain-containing protein n=1 Tax=Pyranulibacter aquaticus TaxID=3163344 RepID=UPI003594E168
MDKQFKKEIDFKTLEEIEDSNEQSTVDSKESTFYNSPKLKRSKKNFIFTGVCGGIADYFKSDPTIIRIIFMLSVFLGGWGVIVYLIASFLMPPDNNSIELTEEEKQKIRNNNNKTLFGGSLLFLGLFILLNNLGLIFYITPFNLSWRFLILLSAILISVYLIVHKEPANKLKIDFPNSLSRSLDDKKIFGICGGFAKYLNVDSTIIRILWLLITYITAGIGLLVYLILLFVLKKQKELNGNTIS